MVRPARQDAVYLRRMTTTALGSLYIYNIILEGLLSYDYLNPDLTRSNDLLVFGNKHLLHHFL